MADKAVGELIEATQITPQDLLVLEQNGVAKKVTGQTLENWLVSFADGHGGIQKIEQTGTTGLVDTYTITLADTTTFTFSVTNGKSIVSITKNGTNVLVDTYVISYNDGSATLFQVTNGRGIDSVSLISTVGLARTYKIAYNDGTDYSFTVTDGAKGDKGDNAYIWVKWASQDPAQPPHSIGDIPDAYMGVYIGTKSAPPTNYAEYAWLKVKGEKGDTGDPATLAGSSVQYQVSSSGTIVPSGEWGNSIPVVPQGSYLWTRTSITFNSGSPIVSYSVTRMGIDGSGSVSSVNDRSPDGTGNVTIDAESTGSLPASGGSMTGAINMQGQAITGLNDPENESDAARKGYVDTKTQAVENKLATYVRPNLLDNWYFPNAVNQRGQASYTHGGYTIDRWIKESSGAVSLMSDGVYLDTRTTLIQMCSPDFMQSLYGKTVTVSMLLTDGRLKAKTSKIPDNPTSKWEIAADFGDFSLVVVCFYDDSGNIISPQLGRIYAGSVTSTIVAVKVELGDTQTLAHQDTNGNWVRNEIPNYGEQLARCQRYLPVAINTLDGTYESVGVGVATAETEIKIHIPYATTPRTTPACSISGIENLLLRGKSFNTVKAISVDMDSKSSVSLTVTPSTNVSVGDTFELIATPNTTLFLSSDL